MKKLPKIRGSRFAVAVIAFGIGGMLAAASVSADELEEIVVTAQKRQERLQDVPISISVLSGEGVAGRSLSDLSSLATQVVGVQSIGSDQGGSNANFYIRGIGQNDFLDTTDPGVGVYIDGVFIARTSGGPARPHRHRPRGSAARSAGYAVRNEHHRRRHQRVHEEAGLHLGRQRIRARRRARPHRRRRHPQCAHHRPDAGGAYKRAHEESGRLWQESRNGAALRRRGQGHFQDRGLVAAERRGRGEFIRRLHPCRSIPALLHGSRRQSRHVRDSAAEPVGGGERHRALRSTVGIPELL